MSHSTEIAAIEALFRNQVRKDKKVRNAYLLVHSNKTGLHLNLAEGPGENSQPNPQQPVYMASVGKLFTSVIVAILHEKGQLSFEDPIGLYLDSELMNGLHIYKAKDYSYDIQIRHLLNQTSGLPDNFYPLFDKLLADNDFEMTPRQAVEWSKKNLKSQVEPGGKKSYYTDTNYHLLGLIVEKVCEEPFHSVLKRLIFDPLKMTRSYMLHYSEPDEPVQKEAGFYFNDTRINEFKGYAGLDFSGGGVVSPMEDLLQFMKALTNHQLISADTFRIMCCDKAKLYPGWDYGYGIWQVRPVPVLLPSKYQSWGVLGASGAFMFYHPELETYLIGSFNHQKCQRKCVRFMFRAMGKLL